MNTKKVYTEEAVREYAKLARDKGGAVKVFYDSYMIPETVIYLAGCKTAVCKPFGTDDNGGMLYTVRRYGASTLPKKYVFEGMFVAGRK